MKKKKSQDISIENTRFVR